MNQNNDNDYDSQWDQWPPIEGDNNEGTFMLGVVLIGTIILYVVMVIYGLTRLF